MSKPKMESNIPVRLTAEVRAELEQAAAREGRTLSGFIRHHALVAASKLAASLPTGAQP